MEIARSVPVLEGEVKWTSEGTCNDDRALTVWRFDLAREYFRRAGDLSALVLLLMATGDREGLKGPMSWHEPTHRGLAVNASRCFDIFV